MGRRSRTPPDDALELADAILADPRVSWFPVKHYSPACAHHVRRLVETLRPAAVLVEGPEDATDSIEHVVDPRTEPPITILSSYVDERNRFGQNGVLSSSPAQPARYRGWWPLVSYSPEYAALVAGASVGATLRFIDAPMVATIPFTHIRPHRRSTAVDDALLAENAWFDALARKQRRRSFESFWESNFETRGLRMDTRDFVRELLVFAWCARRLSPPEAREEDGTDLREAHMRWHVDRALKEFEGRIVVVTGAYHSVALPWIRGKRAPERPDRYTTTLLGAHSYRALARLYHMNRSPGWGDAVHRALETGEERPFDVAADRLIVSMVRSAREAGLGIGTADAAAAAHLARGLADLRGDIEVTRDDLLDAVQSTFVKGELGTAGEPVLAIARDVLVGTRVGRVTPAAGQVPLIADYYAQARAHRITLDGAARTVRCDLLRRETHRRKSAFLHRCAWLDLPMFEPLEHGSADRPWFRGPDLASGEGLHLLGETWGVRWTEEVDDRLLELSDRGTTLEEVASVVLDEQLDGASVDVARAGRLLLEAARMLLDEPFEAALSTVASAMAVDGVFAHQVEALGDLVLLHGYRDALPTAGDPRVAELVAVAHERACLALPALRQTPPEEAASALDDLQTLVRITLTFEGAKLDERLLVERIREMVADTEGEPMVRGAGYGVLHGFGAARAGVVARALESYTRATPERARRAGAFLDGLFLTGKGLLLRSPRLLRAVDRVISGLDWETFKRILPDLRRAFTRFVPTEIDAIGHRLAQELRGATTAAEPPPLSDEVLNRLRTADERVLRRLREWERPQPG